MQTKQFKLRKAYLSMIVIRVLTAVNNPTFHRYLSRYATTKEIEDWVTLELMDIKQPK